MHESLKLEFDPVSFREFLINWWQIKGRDYPWRNTNDPYNILIAETLLHRTKADQVVPVYEKFIEDFPSLVKVAEASKEEVFNLVHSLGLRWRAEALYSMANIIVDKFNGTIPVNFEQLLSLPGISHYKAASFRCFAFGYPEIILDTNSVRIIGRVCGIKINDSSRRSKRFRHLMEILIHKGKPREFNFALLDLGALVCHSRKPLCSECPIKNICKYNTTGESYA